MIDEPQIADSVCRCVSEIGRLLMRANGGENSPPLNYFLTNGKIEKQLKTFIGTAWAESNLLTRSYVMDKRPFPRCEIDLLAFEDAKPAFFIETKSCFAEDTPNVVAAAYGAIAQTQTLVANLADQTNPRARQFHGCFPYIVHFINSVPENDAPLLPRWLLDRYPRGVPMQEQTLIDLYKQKLPNCNSAYPITIWDNPRLYAIVVKCNPPSATTTTPARQHFTQPL